MTSPFERFTRPSDQFEQDATKVHSLVHDMAEEDAELTIAFLMAGIITLGIRHEVPPHRLTAEFRRAITSFCDALTAIKQPGMGTEH